MEEVLYDHGGADISPMPVERIMPEHMSTLQPVEDSTLEQMDIF